MLLPRVHPSPVKEWQLKPMAEDAWYGTTGQPLQTAIYCANTLGLQPTKTIEVLCNITNPAIFSQSGADMLMAARFGGDYSYGAGLWSSNASSTPYTTDPNTPWMVADIVMTVTRTKPGPTAGRG